MPSVRPLRRVSVTSLAAATSRALPKKRALAIDLAEFVGFQHHRFGGLGARRARHQARHRREQVAGVFHRRRAQDAVERAGLDQPAVAHHRDAVGDLGDHAHVVGDEQHGGAVIALQVADQGQDLLLRGDVERRGRLVRDQQFRLQHQRHRDHDALALAARQPVRIGGEDALHLGQPDLLHHRQNLLAPRAGVEIGMDAQHLVDLAADRHHRIERRHRLLKDHRHAWWRATAAAAGRWRSSSSSPTSLMLPPDGTSAPFCNSPITVSDVTDLPEPLSPTTHSVSPSRTCSETPSMMRSPPRLLAEADDEIVDVENDVGHVTFSAVIARSAAKRSRRPSFRDDAQHRLRQSRAFRVRCFASPRNDGFDVHVEAVTCRPPAVSCGDRARRARRRRSD